MTVPSVIAGAFYYFDQETQSYQTFTDPVADFNDFFGVSLDDVAERQAAFNANSAEMTDEEIELEQAAI